MTIKYKPMSILDDELWFVLGDDSGTLSTAELFESYLIDDVVNVLREFLWIILLPRLKKYFEVCIST